MVSVSLCDSSVSMLGDGQAEPRNRPLNRLNPAKKRIFRIEHKMYYIYTIESHGYFLTYNYIQGINMGYLYL